MRVADGSSVMGNDIWNLVLSEFLLQHLAEFERGLLGIDLDSLEASLNVVKHTEVFSGFLEGDDIHKAAGESVVSTDAVVNLDVLGVSVSADLEDFLTVEGVLQSVSEEDRDREAVSHLVGTGTGAGSVDSTKLSQKPVLGRKHALHMLLRTSCL